MSSRENVMYIFCFLFQYNINPPVFFRCEPPKCKDRCYKNTDCPNNHLCKDGHCIDYCEKSTDCPPKDKNRAICKHGKCYYILVGCDMDHHCPTGYRCHNRKCIKSKCSTNEQCQQFLGQEGVSCINGKCIISNTCKSDKYCRYKYGRRFKCIQGHCKKVLINQRFTSFYFIW